MRTSYGTIAFITLAVALIGGGSAAGQTIGTRQKPGDPMLVRVVGCLEQTANGWVLTRATKPAEDKSPGSSPASLKEAGTMALGTQRIRLIGLSVFTPEAQKGHKLEVKGILIQDPKDLRVNVTSLQTASTTCGK